MSSKQQNQIAYADCFSGVSGDMFLGALIDAGLPLDHLQKELKKLDLEEFTIRSFKQQDQAISGVGITIDFESSEKTRTWKDIRTLIEKSGLKKATKEKSLKIFTCLAEVMSAESLFMCEHMIYQGNSLMRIIWF